MPRKTICTDEMIEKIVSLIDSGLNNRDICDIVGINEVTFYNWFNWGEKLSSKSLDSISGNGLKYVKFYNLVDRLSDSRREKLTTNYVVKESTGRCVYLVRETWRGYIKIGIAKDLKARMSGLQSGCPQDLEVVAYFESENARTQEKHLHNRYSHKRIRNEWFDLTEHDVDVVCEYLNASISSKKVTQPNLLDKIIGS